MTRDIITASATTTAIATMTEWTAVAMTTANTAGMRKAVVTTTADKTVMREV